MLQTRPDNAVIAKAGEGGIKKKIKSLAEKEINPFEGQWWLCSWTLSQGWEKSSREKIPTLPRAEGSRAGAKRVLGDQLPPPNAFTPATLSRQPG